MEGKVQHMKGKHALHGQLLVYDPGEGDMVQRRNDKNLSSFRQPPSGKRINRRERIFENVHG